MDYAYIKSLFCDEDYVICADSGYDHAMKMGISVDLAVGDFDSAKHMPPKEIMRVFPERKDFTDTELALGAARELGFCNFMFLAATGTRLDHSLANILLLKSCAERGENACIVNEHNAVYALGQGVQTLELCVDVGQIVSLVPIESCTSVTVQGLEYPLNNAGLSVGTSLGVSNAAVCGIVSVSIASGLLLVIAAKD